MVPAGDRSKVILGQYFLIKMIDTWPSLALSLCRVFHSRAYESDHLAVFHSQYINDMVRAGNRSRVILGQYFLPPQDIVDCECQRRLDNICPFFPFFLFFFNLFGPDFVVVVNEQHHEFVILGGGKFRKATAAAVATLLIPTRACSTRRMYLCRIMLC